VPKIRESQTHLILARPLGAKIREIHHTALELNSFGRSNVCCESYMFAQAYNGRDFVSNPARRTNIFGRDGVFAEEGEGGV